MEFECFLAQKLSMTIGELRDRMGNGEFLIWSRYYLRKAQAEELERLKAGA